MLLEKFLTIFFSKIYSTKIVTKKISYYKLQSKTFFGISPIVQLFSEQNYVTSSFLSLVIMIIKTNPFRQQGMEKSRDILTSSLQKLVKSSNSNSKIVKRATECWFGMENDSDEVVQAFYQLLETDEEFTKSNLSVIGVLAKNLPEETTRRIPDVWNKMKPQLNEFLQSNNSPKKTARKKGRQSQSSIEETIFDDERLEYLRHVVKCCTRFCESLKAPADFVVEFYDILIDLCQSESKILQRVL